jgi:tetratricopeptide (TPR) repeat protein
LLNLGVYYEWTGDPEKALAQYRRQAAFYTKHKLPDRLPGEFWPDRADCLVTIANLELDLGEKGGEWRKQLNEALGEYTRLASDLKDNNELKKGEAWALLVRGKGHFMTGDLPNAKKDIKKANYDLPRLVGKDPEPADLYRLAVARAWMGEVDPEDKADHHKSALKDLTSAVKKGFRHLPRLERERGFHQLKDAEETKAGYAKLVTGLREFHKPRP